jgi:hypothetical protein
MRGAGQSQQYSLDTVGSLPQQQDGPQARRSPVLLAARMHFQGHVP